MTESGMFFDGTSYTEAQFAEFMHRIMMTDGYVDGIGDDLACIQATPAAMSVVISTGEAWVQGTKYKNSAALTKTIEAADPANPRIDRIILRVSWSGNSVASAVLKGTAAASPSAPDLTQTDATWEISLCQVAVAAAATSIVTANITDERTMACCNVGAISMGTWAAWTPTLAWTTGTPSSVTQNCRWVQYGKIVFFTYNIYSTDSNGCTHLTITLPLNAADTSAYYQHQAQVRYGAAGADYKDPGGVVAGNDNKVSFWAFPTCTDGQLVYVFGSGFYEAP